MTRNSTWIGTCVLGAALASSLLGLACGGPRPYRVYDPYYSDYHVWNNDETVYYQQWARENHHDEHADFRKLPPEDQKSYWNWRHSHGDHDKDHDHH